MLKISRGTKHPFQLHKWFSHDLKHYIINMRVYTGNEMNEANIFLWFQFKQRENTTPCPHNRESYISSQINSIFLMVHYLGIWTMVSDFTIVHYKEMMVWILVLCSKQSHTCKLRILARSFEERSWKQIVREKLC